MTQWPVSRLLPHAGDMILLDSVSRHDADSLTAHAVIRPGPYSLPDGSLPPWLGMELMAQAVGAWAGCQARQANEAVKLGFLLGTRRYECLDASLPAGMAVTIHVERGLIDASGMSVFECELRDDTRVLATARLNVYQPSDPQTLMQEEAPQ